MQTRGFEVKTVLARWASACSAFRRPFSHASPKQCADVDLLRGLSRRGHPPSYATRSTIEALLLLRARSIVWGVGSVVIDYAATHDGPCNWRLLGFAYGTAEHDKAAYAVHLAAASYSDWILVPDGDPRTDRPVDLKATSRDCDAQRS